MGQFVPRAAWGKSDWKEREGKEGDLSAFADALDKLLARRACKNAESARASAKAVGRKTEKTKGTMGRRRGSASRCEIPDRAGAGAARKTAEWSVEFKLEV